MIWLVLALYVLGVMYFMVNTPPGWPWWHGVAVGLYWPIITAMIFAFALVLWVRDVSCETPRGADAGQG